MNHWMRVLLVGVLMTPALTFAQTSFPRCTDTRTVVWPSGGNGCRESLPEEPPPRPGDSFAISAPASEGMDSPSEAPPVWLDFDPALVPTFDGTVEVGLDLRTVPSAIDSASSQRLPPLTLLEYALKSEDFSGDLHFDVISAKLSQTIYGTRLMVEHRRSDDAAWSVVKGPGGGLLVSSAVFWTADTNYWPNTVMLKFERRTDQLVLRINDREVVAFPLFMRDATPYRLRRGLFGRDLISTEDRVILDWFRPVFYLASGSTDR